MATSQQPSITLATTDDVHEIHAMICELASYEKALDAVEATEETLRQTLTFANSPSTNANPGYAKTLILRLPSTSTPNSSDRPSAVAGMAMFFTNYSTWTGRPGIHLEDLYVRPEYRGRGYGKMLIQALAKETLRIGGKRLEWNCLEWNESSLNFYDSLGAKQMKGWVGLRLDGAELEKMAVGKEGKTNGLANGHS